MNYDDNRGQVYSFHAYIIALLLRRKTNLQKQVNTFGIDAIIKARNVCGGPMVFLTVNAGSSSLKVSVFDDATTDGSISAISAVSIENIGTAEACLIVDDSSGSSISHDVVVNDHAVASMLILDRLAEQGFEKSQIRGVGYRFVHGGPHYDGEIIADDEVVNCLQSIANLAPNHTPVALACLEEFRNSLAEAEHVLCFDTAFFHDLPVVAQTIALPARIRDMGVKKYGFHGLSYEYLLDDFAKNEGETAMRGRVIMAHLGSGASLTATYNGSPVDTTMSFTPASGIVMSSRTGDIDPGIIDYLIREKGMTGQEISQIIYKESGLLGLSGETADMRKLLDQASYDKGAELAIDIFCYNIKKTIGAYSAILGGLDSLIFSAGIGERSAKIRELVTSGLEFMGIEIDEQRNREGVRLISAEGSKVGVHVIPTHEDRVIAQKTIRLIEEKI